MKVYLNFYLWFLIWVPGVNPWDGCTYFSRKGDIRSIFKTFFVLGGKKSKESLAYYSGALGQFGSDQKKINPYHFSHLTQGWVPLGMKMEM